jgi:hypothetical protein
LIYSSVNGLNFQDRLDTLLDNTNYFVRAFVQNTYQTALSSEILSFQTKKFYQNGETGPAGGKIFYSSIDGSTTWHFLEAAPSDYNSSLVWSNNNLNIAGLNYQIGSGKENTNLIVTNQGTSGLYAAYAAEQYSTNGFNDWFLPSLKELEKLMLEAQSDVSYNIIPEFEYWTSNQDLNYQQNAFIAKNPNTQLYSKQKSGVSKVRFVRRF